MKNWHHQYSPWKLNSNDFDVSCWATCDLSGLRDKNDLRREVRCVAALPEPPARRPTPPGDLGNNVGKRVDRLSQATLIYMPSLRIEIQIQKRKNVNFMSHRDTGLTGYRGYTGT